MIFETFYICALWFLTVTEEEGMTKNSCTGTEDSGSQLINPSKKLTPVSVCHNQGSGSTMADRNPAWTNTRELSAWGLARMVLRAEFLISTQNHWPRQAWRDKNGVSTTVCHPFPYPRTITHSGFICKHASIAGSRSSVEYPLGSAYKILSP